MIPVNESNAAEKAKAVRAGELPGAAKSLAEAVCRVMEQVGYVQKDKRMQSGGSYRYVSVEAVIDALRPEMIKQQLVLLPSDVQPLTLEHFEGKNGGRQNRTQLKYTFKLLHAPSGESEPVVVIGEAIDVGDKSSNKAMTAARKYALILAFNIETGDDPDDTPSHTQERAQPTQQPAPQKPANVALRARYAMRLGQCKTREEYQQACADIGVDVKAGLLTDADRDALAAVAKETAARFQTTKA